MGRKALDLIGRKFGKLVVLERVENKWECSRWLCRCECGNEKIILGNSLKRGTTQSCGCLVKENKGRTTTHNESNTRIYRTWSRIKERCNNPNNKSYKDYGDRGITVCDEWLNDYKIFRDWALENGYKDNLSIDRINVDGNYEPNNCKWATNLEQANNKRNTIYVKYNNETKSLSAWCRELELPYGTMHQRINQQNWSPERAFTTPIKNRKLTDKELLKIALDQLGITKQQLRELAE